MLRDIIVFRIQNVIVKEHVFWFLNIVVAIHIKKFRTAYIIFFLVKRHFAKCYSKRDETHQIQVT